MKKVIVSLCFLAGFASIGLGCSTEKETNTESTVSVYDDEYSSEGQGYRMEMSEEANTDSAEDWGCDGPYISLEAAEQMLRLTEVTEHEDIYTTYKRIDEIAGLFQSCEDTWGLFPTTYRHITRRIIQAIETGEIEDVDWAKKIVVDFAGRYLLNLQKALRNEQPSYAWAQYYYLADRDDVSRTRAVVVAMVAHLTLDLPYSLVAVESTEDHKDDYFVLGELMIEITPDFIADLMYFYDTDAEDFLTGFFMGDWVDGAFGRDTTITFSYQSVRTKSWNNRWLLEQSWGGWLADSEIYAAFWASDGILATLDASGAI